MRNLLLLFSAIVLTPGGPAPQASSQSPQPATSIVESYTRARAIVEAAIAAHGGPSALSALDKSRVVLEGPYLYRYQSRRVSPPYDQDTDRVELLIDLPNRVLQNRWFAYPGGARRHTGFITDGPKGFSVNFRNGTHSTSAYPPAATQTGNLYYLPHYVLRDLSSRWSALTWLGRMRLHNGDEVDVVTGATASGPGTVTAAFDPRTHLLRATLSPSTDLLDGTVASETHYVDYRTLNGVFVPTRRVSYLNGVVTRDLTYQVVEPGYNIPTSALVPPAGSVDITEVPPVPLVQPLAAGVWAVGGGTSALVVAFNDHVLVVDAPSNSANIITQIGTLAPGKPIRYVVPTHHHDDHSSGVRQFVAAGATIVTTERDRTFMERVARANTVRVETLSTGSRVFTDGTRTVEIHNIGPGPHAEDMLVAWIPEEGILYQADLIEGPVGGVLAASANNETTMHFASWLKLRNWPVKVFAGSHGSLPSPAAFDALIKAPIIPLR